MSGRAFMKSSRIAIAPASQMPKLCPVATIRPEPSPTISPMRETEGSHSTAPSILPLRRLVAITSIDWLKIAAGLILVRSITRPRKRCAQLPCGVAICLPSSHLIAASGESNFGASARTMMTRRRCPPRAVQRGKYASFDPRGCEIACNQRGEPPHDHEACLWVALQHAERALPVDPQHRRRLQAARARDPRRITVEERRPAEHF